MTAPTTEQVREAVERLRDVVGPAAPSDEPESFATDIRTVLDALEASEKKLAAQPLFVKDAQTGAISRVWRPQDVAAPSAPAEPSRVTAKESVIGRHYKADSNAERHDGMVEQAASDEPSTTEQAEAGTASGNRGDNQREPQHVRAEHRPTDLRTRSGLVGRSESALHGVSEGVTVAPASPEPKRSGQMSHREEFEKAAPCDKCGEMTANGPDAASGIILCDRDHNTTPLLTRDAVFKNLLRVRRELIRENGLLRARLYDEASRLSVSPPLFTAEEIEELMQQQTHANKAFGRPCPRSALGCVAAKIAPASPPQSTSEGR